MEAIEAKMNIKIADNDIDRTHRIRKPKNNSKARPVIIKFVEGFGCVNNGELGCIPYEEIK